MVEDEELKGGRGSHREENEEKEESEREVGVWGHPSSFRDPRGLPTCPSTYAPASTWPLTTMSHPALASP